ncbi:MAG: pentapeptide repeat-containing protein [Saprospiraceae bacterium]|nr:pentapeptide repeat-containing protein [Saprospiraceae bacterium]
MKNKWTKWKYCLFVAVLPLFACHTQQDVPAQGGDITAEQILKMLEKGKPLIFENAVIQDDLFFADGLNRFDFSGEVTSTLLDQPVVFSNCRFKGKVFAQRPDETGKLRNKMTWSRIVRFQNCSFEADVSFVGCQFQSDCNFSGSTFEATANFDNTSFHGIALFQSCQFLDQLFMSNAFFLRDLVMSKSNFKGQSAFQGNQYQSAAQFTEAVFQDYADFSNQDFRSGAYFTYSQFQGRCTFGYSRFLGAADFNRLRFAENASFEACTFFGRARFNGSEYRKILELKESRHLGPAIEMMDLIVGPEGQLNQD